MISKTQEGVLKHAPMRDLTDGELNLAFTRGYVSPLMYASEQQRRTRPRRRRRP